MSTRLEFEIEFKSDYHIGAGYGLGLQVDSALLRDADGVPVIRGTVLAGLLRESLANLLTLQPFARPDCQQLLERVFGSPRQLKRWRISSARPAGLLVPQVRPQKQRMQFMVAQTTTRARINPRTRRVEENKLFTHEDGDGSLRFRFVAECECDDAIAQQEAEYIVAAARMLRNLGAGKRRGYGECEIHLVDRNRESELLTRLAKRLKSETVPESAPEIIHDETKPFHLPTDTGNHTYRLRVIIRLDEPLLIARRAEAGNQYETLDMIPGSVLRGALAWCAAKRLGQQLQGSVYRCFVELFYRDTVRFSMLTPVEVSQQASGYPTIIAPRDLLTCELHPGYADPSRDKGHGVWSLFDPSAPEECPRCKRTGQLTSLGGFISLVRGMPRSRHKPSTMVEMHIRIDPDSGRVRTGDLYGYVALEPGQYFVGEVTCTDQTVWDLLQNMANLQPNGEVNELHLGKATQRGYGKVSAVFQPINEPLFSLQPLTKRLTSTKHVTMLLLSDAIIVDPWGRFWRGFDAAWLQRELQLLDSAEVSIDCNQNGEALAFSAVRTVDSFNATLGLPRARDIAIVAGSSVRLSFKGIELDDLIQRLKEVENRGIGLRREEGFGRVAFNHPIYRQLEGIDSPMLDLTSLQMASAEQSTPLVAVLAFTREWEEKLEAKAKSFACFNDGRFETIARLLHISQHTSVDAIKQDLQRSGNAENILGKSLSGRDKPNFFTADGKSGMDVIDKLLDVLVDKLRQHKLDQHPQAWRIGLQMLAARIAAPARQKAEERR
ncbi:MAG: RAMP superfamily CRISPR-associated protein [Chloroflexus sp.]|uniref:RAMP superfamily CRISPR-associated protein n=1 Tax=Chloroflexus sp. TaxID=1904827 RepID=UPI003D0E0859